MSPQNWEAPRSDTDSDVSQTCETFPARACGFAARPHLWQPLARVPAPGALLPTLANICAKQPRAARMGRSREAARAAPAGCSGGIPARGGHGQPRQSSWGQMPAWVFTERFSQCDANGSSPAQRPPRPQSPSGARDGDGAGPGAEDAHRAAARREHKQLGGEGAVKAVSPTDSLFSLSPTNDSELQKQFSLGINTRVPTVKAEALNERTRLPGARFALDFLSWQLAAD